MEKAEIVKSTIAYIEMQLDNGVEALSLDDIASKIGYSKFYLSRVINEYLGITIYHYIMERRLTEAAKKLVYTDKPIADIAFEAGYQSQQAFTNVFSKNFLCSPMKYRSDKLYFPLRNPYQVQCILGMYVYNRGRLVA